MTPAGLSPTDPWMVEQSESDGGCSLAHGQKETVDGEPANTDGGWPACAAQHGATTPACVWPAWPRIAEHFGPAAHAGGAT